MSPAPVRPGFGRLIAPDARDKQYPMRALTRRIALPASRMWSSRRAYVLDQGPTPHCVGFAWAAFLEAAPHMHQLTNEDGHRFYAIAQDNDEWPGTDYDGSSTRGGAKALVSLGLITGEYVWAETEEDVWRFVRGRGAVVTGTTWLTGMMQTDSKGYVNLTGGEEGGHDWCIIGASDSRQAYRAQQSWGEWGQQGRFWIRRVGTREDSQANRDEARDQGYSGDEAVWCSLRDHEVIHHLIPLWLWDSASPTLLHECGGERCPYYDRLYEEALVISFQKHLNTGSVPKALKPFEAQLSKWRARYADALLRMEEIAA